MKKTPPAKKTPASPEPHAEEHGVRTNIIMEEPLVYAAQAITGITTKTGVVHHALRELVRRNKMKDALKMRGKVTFMDGYVDEHVKA